MTWWNVWPTWPIDVIFRWKPEDGASPLFRSSEQKLTIPMHNDGKYVPPSPWRLTWSSDGKVWINYVKLLTVDSTILVVTSWASKNAATDLAHRTKTVSGKRWSMTSQFNIKWRQKYQHYIVCWTCVIVVFNTFIQSLLDSVELGKNPNSTITHYIGSSVWPIRASVKSIKYPFFTKLTPYV